MIVTCPHCDTHYDVEDACIPTGGRSVRCAACSGSWYVPSPVPIDMLTPLNPDGPAKITASQRHHRHFGRGGQAEITSTVTSPSMRTAQEPRIEGATALAYLQDTAPEPIEGIEEADWEQIEAEVHALSQSENAATSPFHRELEDLEKALTERGPGTDPQPSSGLMESATPQADHPDLSTAIVPHDPEAAQQAQDLHSLTKEAGLAVHKLASALTRSAALALKKINRISLPAIALPNKKKPTAEEEAPFVYTPGDDVVDSFREQRRKQERKRLTPMKVLGWVSWLVVLGGALSSVFIFRTQIMAFTPGSEKLYQALGLYEPDIYPVRIISVQHRYAISSAGPVVELRGTILHDGETPLPAPMLRAEAFDSQDILLAAWEFAPSSRQLLPSMEAPFLSRAPAPQGVSRVKLTIVPPDNTVLPLGEEDQNQFYMESMTGGWSSDQEPPPVALSDESATKPASE